MNVCNLLTFAYASEVQTLLHSAVAAVQDRYQDLQRHEERISSSSDADRLAKHQQRLQTVGAKNEALKVRTYL